MMFVDSLVPKNVLAIFLVLATFGLWAQHAEIQHQKLKAARLELEIKTLEADAATRLAAASEQARATEHKWSTAVSENSNEANRLVSQVRTAAARGAVAGSGLRDRAADAAARCRSAPEAATAAAGSSSAADAGLLLADVLGQLEREGRLHAEESTKRGIAGTACQLIYEVTE